MSARPEPSQMFYNNIGYLKFIVQIVMLEIQTR